MNDDIGVDRKMSAQDAEALMNRVMKRQAGLSLKVAIVFISILILLPLFNLFAPELNTRTESACPREPVDIGLPLKETILFIPVRTSP